MVMSIISSILLLVAASSFLFVARIVLQLFRSIIWRPYALTKFFRKQGISGPSYKFLSGSLDEINSLKRAATLTVLPTNSDVAERAAPHYQKWSSLYGEIFLYWQGTQPRVYISDPELAKQILANNFGFYGKSTPRPLIMKMIGYGLAMVNGLDWVRHKRIINPAFNVDKLKAMINRIAECTIPILDEWKIQSSSSAGHDRVIHVNDGFQKMTADIIAHIAFGSSYVEGREVFKAQQELQRWCIASFTDIVIPGSQLLPTPNNLQIWKLESKLKNSLRQIIESRLSRRECRTSNSYYENDLLGLMIESLAESGTKVGSKMNMDEIMDECKTFFFAGHETTSNLLSWTVYLLSVNQDWQEKLREEVMRECGMNIPDADMLSKLRLVNMVLLEALRLYCPIMEMIRTASQDMRLGDLLIPKDTCIVIPILMIQKMEKYWGKDANQFNPLRFANGLSKAATHPNAFLAFALGPRACIGQTFAIMEAKTVMALLLQRLSFTLSPEYKHAPADYLTLQPQYGIPVIFKKI